MANFYPDRKAQKAAAARAKAIAEQATRKLAKKTTTDHARNIASKGTDLTKNVGRANVKSTPTLEAKSTSAMALAPMVKDTGKADFVADSITREAATAAKETDGIVASTGNSSAENALKNDQPMEVEKKVSIVSAVDSVAENKPIKALNNKDEPPVKISPESLEPKTDLAAAAESGGECASEPPVVEHDASASAAAEPEPITTTKKEDTLQVQTPKVPAFIKKAGFLSRQYKSSADIVVPSYIENKDIASATSLMKKPYDVEFPSLKKASNAAPTPAVKTTLSRKERKKMEYAKKCEYFFLASFIFRIRSDTY